MTSRIINNPALASLSTELDLTSFPKQMTQDIGKDELAPLKAISVDSKAIPVKLRRTFNMTFEGVTMKFWRVIGPSTHKNYESDLSIEGLKDWGIIP